jgi:hypothetical protein
MRPYIVNLTNNLIGKHRFDDLILMYLPNRQEFIQCAKIELQTWDVADMSPETLGRIMGFLETGDVIESKAELLSSVRFHGECGDMLRELVAICLAYVIAARFEPDETRENHIPGYRHTQTRSGKL